MVEYYGKFYERNFPQALLVGADISIFRTKPFPHLAKGQEQNIEYWAYIYHHDNQEITVKIGQNPNF